MSEKQTQLQKPKFLNPFKYVRRDQILLLIIGILLAFISGLVPVAATVILGQVFEVLTDFVNGDFSSNSDFYNHALFKCSMFLVISAATLLLNWLVFFIWMKVGEFQAATVREKLFDRYVSKPFSWYDENKEINGEYTHLNRCVEEFRAGSSEASAMTIQTLATILASMCVSFYYSYLLTFVILASFPLIAGLTALTSLFMVRNQVLENSFTATAADTLDWVLNAHRLVKHSMTTVHESTKFASSIATSKGFYLKYNFYSASQAGIVRILMLAIFVQAFWFGSHLVRTQNLSPGSVLVCLSACLVFASSISAMLHHLNFLQKAMVCCLQIDSFLEAQKELNEDKRSSPYLTNLHQLSLENVTFSYPGRAPALRNISMVFPSNRISFVVGKSGSGKSTIGQLVLRLYDVESGDIKINGCSIDTRSQEWLFNNITYAQQESSIFSVSIYENVAMGALNYPNVRREDVEKVLDLVCLRPFIGTLARGINTTVDGLSGGQHQRIVLARALLRDTPILILDESFSALDRATKNQIIFNVRSYRSNMTTIIITHDLNDIGDSDLTYVLDNGKLVSHGLKKSLNEDLFMDMKHYSSQDSEETKVEDILEYYQEHSRWSSDEKFPKISHVKNIDRKSSFKEIFNIGSSITNDVEQALEVQYDQIYSLWFILRFMISKIKVSLLIAGMFAACVCGVCTPLMSFYIAKVIEGLVSRRHSDNVKWSLVVLSIIILDGLFTFLRQSILGFIAESWISSLRVDIFHNLIAQSTRWYDANHSRFSEISSLIMNDARDLRQFVVSFLSLICLVSVALVLGLIWALVVGWQVALIGIAIVIVFGAITMSFSLVLQNCEKIYKDQVDDLESQNYSVINAIRTVKVLNLVRIFKSKFELNLSKVSSEGNKRALCLGLSIGLSTFLSYIAQMVLLYFGLHLIGSGSLTISHLMSVYSLLIFTIMTVVQSVSQLSEIGRGKRAGSYLITLYNLTPTDFDSPGTKSMPHGHADSAYINFHRLCFSYNPATPVLSNLSMEILKGEVVALTGKSGCGKSTIAALLTKLYCPPKRSVYIGNIDINDIRTSELRKTIAIVDQKAEFFKGTIAENLVYGLHLEHDFVQSDLERVLDQVGMLKFVEDLPLGLNTFIGGSSTLLSGGQAQRLSIARALLRNPEILIMDECTSALDAYNTKLICDFITNNLVHRNYRHITCILITHSEEVMKTCSRVIEIDK